MRALTFALTISLISHSAGADPAAPDARTRRTWKAKCASCHGEDGKGKTEQAKKLGGLKDLSDPAVQKDFDDARLKEIIQKGVTEKKDGKEVQMKGNPDIAGEQLEGLVQLVRGLAAGK